MSSFGSNLVRRRVPQIVGLYIAAMWMCVEIGDWVTERFDLTSSLTSYLFIAMAILLPSVALLAYGHGAPGRDHWTKAEKLLVPVNIIAAAIALVLIQPGQSAQAAVETMTMMDEDGVEQIYAVAKTGQVKRLYVAFLDNETGDPEVDWLGAGIPWILDADLDQNIFVNFHSPFNDSVISLLKTEGFDDGRDVPLTLTLELARERNAPLAVRGAYRLDGDVYTVDLQLYDSGSGELSSNVEATGADLLAVIDQLSKNLAKALDLPTLPERLRADLPVEELLSSSMPAIDAAIAGELAVRYGNDYPGGIGHLERAVELDPDFARAIASLAAIEHLSGNSTRAAELVDNALALDYKLSEDMEFKLKAVRYETRGEYPKMLKLAKLWTEVSPTNADAWNMLATVLQFEGDKFVDTLAALEKRYELDPANSVLKSIAKIEAVLGRHEAARTRLQRYLERQPDDGEALSQLASLSALEGDFEGARAALERGAFLGSSSTSAELGLIELDIREGAFDKAQRELDALKSQALSPTDSVMALNREVGLAIIQGRLTHALALIDEAEENLSTQLPPLQIILNLGFTRVIMLSQLGRYDDALAVAENMREQLQGPLSQLASLAELAVYSIKRDDAQLELAIENANKALEELQLQPTVEAAIDGARATLMEMRGNFEQAAEWHEVALQKFRQFALLAGEAASLAQIETDLVGSLVAAGRTSDAQALLDGIFTYFPSYVPAKLELARLYQVEGRLDEARETLQEILGQWAEADETYVHYMRALDLAGELGVAVAAN